jgi:phosphatidylglycerophosphatase A
MRRVGVLVATVGGAGYFPVAPGTVGSAVGVGIYLLLPPAWLIPVTVLVTLVGIWASGEAARHFAREDPGPVVVDEVAGQLLTLILTGVGVRGAVLGFLLFRILDIVKPWPANRFERLPGGWGIMADDLMAGVYGNVLMQVAVRIAPSFLL